MGELQKFSRNSFFLAISYFLRFSSGLLLTVLVGKSVTEDDFGRLSLALTIATFFGVAADFGLPQLTIRDVAQNHDIAPRYYRNVLTLKTIFSLICSAGLIGFVQIMNYPAETRAVIYPIAAFTFIASVGSYHYFLFRGLEQMQYEAVSAIVHNLLLIVCVLVVLLMPHRTIERVSYGYLAAGIISTAAIIILFGRKAGGARFSFNLAQWKTLLKRSNYFALYGFLGLVYMSIDVVMIPALRPADWKREVAIYQAPVKLLAAGVFAVGILMNVYLPMLSRRFKGPADEFRGLVHTLNRLGIIIVAPIVVFPFMFSREIMTLFFKPEYAASAIPLQILCVGFLAWYGPPYGTVFSAMEKQEINFYVSAICAVFNVALNVVLLPMFPSGLDIGGVFVYYGPLVAASTTLATYLLMKVLYAYYCRKHLGSVFIDFRYLLTLALCAVIVAGLKLSGVHELIARLLYVPQMAAIRLTLDNLPVIVAGVIFCTLYAVCGYFMLLNASEKKLLSRLIKRQEATT